MTPNEIGTPKDFKYQYDQSKYFTSKGKLISSLTRSNKNAIELQAHNTNSEITLKVS